MGFLLENDDERRRGSRRPVAGPRSPISLPHLDPDALDAADRSSCLVAGWGP
jgi:hypothetical protein